MLWIANQTRKIRWRLEFLADPAAYVLRQPSLAQACGGPLHDALVSGAKALSWGERLAFTNPFAPEREIEDFLLLKRLRRSRDGSPYFDIDGTKIYFCPESNADMAAVLEGTLLVLKEAYVLPIEFFSPEVTIRPGDVVLDLGGHIGTSAFLFSQRVGPSGQVFSFEPLFHHLLQKNVRENRIENVQVIPKGVSDAPGEAEFAVTPMGVDSRLARPVSKGGRVRLEVTTLDDFVAQEGLDRVDFVKMDIEGAEELAIRGAMEMIRRFRPKLSIASYHTDSAGERQHPKLMRLLADLGYHIEEIEHRRIYAW